MGRKKEFTGIWIPREVWEDERLSVYDKVAFAVISGLARGEGGCFATNKALAEFCKMSERQICKSIAVLSESGYIRVENAGTPVRRIHAEERTTCAVRTHDVRDNNAQCAESERTTCEVRTHDVRSSDENLPIILNYNNNYNNIYNNAREKEPTREEIEGFIRERKAMVDPVRFYEYYAASNWVDKDGSAVNWRQKVLIWDRNNRGQTAAANKNDDGTFGEGSFETSGFLAAALARTYGNENEENMT
jgi:hypothetical protein